MIFTLEDHPRFFPVAGVITCYFLGLVIAPNVKRKEEWAYKYIENMAGLGIEPMTPATLDRSSTTELLSLISTVHIAPT